MTLRQLLMLHSPQTEHIGLNRLATSTLRIVKNSATKRFLNVRTIRIKGADFKSDPSELLEVTFVSINQFNDGVMISPDTFGNSYSVGDQVEFLDFN